MVEKIDHHRTGTVHEVKQEVPGFGTKTKCGIMVPHSTDTSDVTEDDEVDCGNCERLE